MDMSPYVCVGRWGWKEGVWERDRQQERATETDISNIPILNILDTCTLQLMLWESLEFYQRVS